MLADCDILTNVRSFNGAFRAALPPYRKAIKAIGVVPSPRGVELVVRAKHGRRERIVGTAVIACSGRWRHHVFVRGVLLAKLRSKLGKGELRLTYIAGRFYLNSLAIPAELDTDLEKFGERQIIELGVRLNRRRKKRA
jgi:hypothetical protein